jgi:hypothetical protein
VFFYSRAYTLLQAAPQYMAVCQHKALYIEKNSPLHISVNFHKGGKDVRSTKKFDAGARILAILFYHGSSPDYGCEQENGPEMDPGRPPTRLSSQPPIPFDADQTPGFGRLHRRTHPNPTTKIRTSIKKSVIKKNRPQEFISAKIYHIYEAILHRL